MARRAPRIPPRDQALRQAARATRSSSRCSDVELRRRGRRGRVAHRSERLRQEHASQARLRPRSPSEGEVFVDGERVTRPTRMSPSCCRRICCCRGARSCENVEFGLEIQGVPARRRARSRSARCSKRCRIAEFADHIPISFRAACGSARRWRAPSRSIPTVLLLDEPFSALDAQTKMVLQQDLRRTIEAAGKTALFITHDLSRRWRCPTACW